MTHANGLTGLFDLSGKVAVVTGAGLGIGKGIALGLAQHGADIVGCDIDDAALAASMAEIEAMGRRTASLRADIGRSEDILALFALVDRAFGRVDILVNNVGIGKRFHPEDLPLEDFRQVMEIGVTGSLQCAQEAGRRMISAGRGGSIINISSIAGASAIGRGNLAHSINKGAINMMTKELAVEWAKYGIRVNAIMPCQVLTEGFQNVADETFTTFP